ncbi:unnamed protein product [Dibothriocephalus latus]|uniref:Uncharacterized protein n=1 Tax=Dibothriocephalus latus TaxID=60516 RepID=A0A3P7LEH9_DIBLA|nr:unnamed protein product [Dibothriocephalus latus]
MKALSVIVLALSFLLLLLLVNPDVKADAAAIKSRKTEERHLPALLIQPVSSAAINSSEKAANLRLSKVVRLLELFVALLHVEDISDEDGPGDTEFRTHKI